MNPHLLEEGLLVEVPLPQTLPRIHSQENTAKKMRFPWIKIRVSGEGAGLELAADPTVDSATTVDTNDSVDRAAQGAEGRDLLQW